jgi:hypothetical protein
MKSMKRDEAISHVVTSTEYWLGSDPSLYAHYDCVERSFVMAIQHVKLYHYPLTKQDIECARKELKRKGHKL